MPVARFALLSRLRGELDLEIIGIIDSAADATMLPLDVLESIGARYAQTRHMRGVTGPPIPVDTYYVTITFGPYIIYGIEVVALPVGSESILGRDVLNQLELTLNGPAQELWLA